MRLNHNAAVLKPVSATADGSGTGLIAMPMGSSKLVISDALTVAPEVVYSPTVSPKAFAINRSLPETAMPTGSSNRVISDVLIVVPGNCVFANDASKIPDKQVVSQNRNTLWIIQPGN